MSEEIVGDAWVDDGFRAEVSGTYLDRDEWGPSEVEERADRAAGRSESLGPAWGTERWNLPGHGESGGRCNEVVVTGVCVAGHVQFGRQSCGRRSCPECWGSWAREAAMRATVRVQAFRLTQPPNRRRQAAHAFVSPPEGEIQNERQYWDGYSKAAEIAEEKGFRGFAVLGHPWRPTPEAKEMYREADPEFGVWVWLRDREDTRELIEWSPHYHILGVTTVDMAAGEESDEWVYHFERSVEAFDGLGDMDAHEDLYGEFRYLLSHTGWSEESTKQVTRWYGDMANSVFVDEAGEDWQHEKPPEREMQRLEEEVAEVAGAGDVEEEGDGVGREEERCACEECEAIVIDVFDLDAYLRQQEPPEEVAEVMRAARDWRLHRVEPPPGLKRPQSEEEAREAFETLL